MDFEREINPMKESSDQEIIATILDGEKDNFRYIIERYQRQIQAYIAKLAYYHPQNVEDIASNTFIKVYINLAKYNPSLKLSSWIYRIAHNEAINYLKKNQKHLSYDPDTYENAVFSRVDFDTPRKEDIESILSRLNTSDRNLLVLFYLEELSIREIAEIMKTTENSIKSRLSQARKKAQKISSTYDQQ